MQDVNTPNEFIYPHPLVTGGVQENYHDADTSKNHAIEKGELDAYVSSWKGTPSISLSDLIESRRVLSLLI